MSLGIYFNAMDTEALVRTIREQPEVLIQRVASKFERFEGEAAIKQATAALRNMVYGLEQTPQLRSRLGDVFLELSGAYSVRMPYGGYYDRALHTEAIEDCMKEDFGLEDFEFSDYFFGRYNHRCPLELPNYGDFPIIGFVPSDALQALATRMAHIAISDDDIWNFKKDGDSYRAESYGHIRGMKADFAFCAEKGLDIFSFCH